jgi:hypothetical protein
MNFETVFEKIKYGTMTLQEFEEWLQDTLDDAHEGFL